MQENKGGVFYEHGVCTGVLSAVYHFS